MIKFKTLTLKNQTTTGFKFVGGSSVINEFSGGTDGIWSAQDTTLTWTPEESDNFTYFALYQNGKVASSTNNLASKNAITIVYEGKEQVATPTFSVDGGPFFEPFNLALSCTTADAKILYTLDGTEPTATSSEYTAPIAISATTTVKAIAAKTGIDTSFVASATYTLCKSYASLADLVAAGQPTTAGETVRVTLTNEIITKKESSYICINSGTQEVKLFCYNVPSTWIVGGKVSGTLVCPWMLYYETWELCPSSWDALSYTAPDKSLPNITATYNT